MKTEKILAFFILCLYVLGAAGGIGYAIYGGGNLIAVGVVALAVMAFDKAEKWWNKLLM